MRRKKLFAVYKYDHEWWSPGHVSAVITADDPESAKDVAARHGVADRRDLDTGYYRLEELSEEELIEMQRDLDDEFSAKLKRITPLG